MSATFSGSAVNAAIVQPYLTLIYIIKTQEKIWQQTQIGQWYQQTDV